VVVDSVDRSLVEDVPRSLRNLDPREVGECRGTHVKQPLEGKKKLFGRHARDAKVCGKVGSHVVSGVITHRVLLFLWAGETQCYKPKRDSQQPFC